MYTSNKQVNAKLTPKPKQTYQAATTLNTTKRVITIHKNPKANKPNIKQTQLYKPQK